MKISCIAVLTAIPGTGRPSILRCSRAARTFAGNRATRSSARQLAASFAVAGNRSPIAPSISRQPVMLTRAGAFGNAKGTMRIKSALPLPQCAEAVTRNIRQSAIRSGRSKLFSAWIPNQPIARRTANEIKRIESGITSGPPMNPIFYWFVENGTTRMLKPPVLRSDRPNLGIMLNCKLLIMNCLNRCQGRAIQHQEGSLRGLDSHSQLQRAAIAAA